MQTARVSAWLRDDYQLLRNYVEGRAIIKILTCTETSISMLMDDNIIVDFIHLEDEIIFDIRLTGEEPPLLPVAIPTKG